MPEPQSGALTTSPRPPFQEFEEMAGAAGLEPTTFGFGDRRSTN
jgi:hypothetical protein